jgi:uncharacterized protein involved in outer membrane biogenesis
MEMQLSANASAQDVPVSLTLHAPGIPLALLARYAALPGDAGGDLRVEMQLKAHGSSTHDLAASLDGSFAATLTHGSLSNAALIELASASLQALGIEVPARVRPRSAASASSARSIRAWDASGASRSTPPTCSWTAPGRSIWVRRRWR